MRRRRCRERSGAVFVSSASRLGWWFAKRDSRGRIPAAQWKHRVARGAESRCGFGSDRASEWDGDDKVALGRRCWSKGPFTQQTEERTRSWEEKDDRGHRPDRKWRRRGPSGGV